MRFVLAAFLVGLVAASPQPTQSQATGVIAGVVRDSSNAIVVGASVQLRAGVRVERAAATDSRGEFRFDKLLPGTYELAVSKTGFAPLTMSVAAVVGKPTSLTLTLQSATTEQKNQDLASEAAAKTATDPLGAAAAPVAPALPYVGNYAGGRGGAGNFRGGVMAPPPFN